VLIEGLPIEAGHGKRLVAMAGRSYWIPGSYATTLSENQNSFLRPLKNKGFKEERVTKIGLYAGGVLNVEVPRSRSVLNPCFNGSKLSELHRHLHFQNTTPRPWNPTRASRDACDVAPDLVCVDGGKRLWRCETVSRPPWRRCGASAISCPP